MRFSRLIAGLVLLLIGVQTAQAWNSTGHMAVALVAYRRLTEEQRFAIGALLKAHPHYQSYLIAQQPREARTDEWAFLRAATWPDYVRGDREHSDPSLEKYHHPKWHYINLPYYWPEKPPADAARRFRAEEPNILSELDENLRLFSDAAAPAEARAIACCWVLHLVGDIHQPLHCATLVSQRFPAPEGDQGGNLLAVRPHTHPERLHTYWDHLVGTSTRFHAIDLAAQKIARVAEQDQELLAELQERKTFDDWADAGLQLAVKYAYLDGRLPLADYRSIEQGSVPASEAPILPSGYGERARDIARRRAALAGYRLAAVLGDIMAAGR